MLKILNLDRQNFNDFILFMFFQYFVDIYWIIVKI